MKRRVFCTVMAGVLLAQSLPLFGAGPLNLSVAHAESLRALVTGIELSAANRFGKAGQKIVFQSDVPFQYSIEVLNDDQVQLTLLNAGLSEALLAGNGLLNIVPGGAVTSAALKPAGSGEQENEQIVLSGPRLGKRDLYIEGAARALAAARPESLRLIPMGAAMQTAQRIEIDEKSAEMRVLPPQQASPTSSVEAQEMVLRPAAATEALSQAPQVSLQDVSSQQNLMPLAAPTRLTLSPPPPKSVALAPRQASLAASPARTDLQSPATRQVEPLDTTLMSPEPPRLQLAEAKPLTEPTAPKAPVEAPKADAPAVNPTRPAKLVLPKLEPVKPVREERAVAQAAARPETVQPDKPMVHLPTASTAMAEPPEPVLSRSAPPAEPTAVMAVSEPPLARPAAPPAQPVSQMSLAEAQSQNRAALKASPAFQLLNNPKAAEAEAKLRLAPAPAIESVARAPQAVRVQTASGPQIVEIVGANSRTVYRSTASSRSSSPRQVTTVQAAQGGPAFPTFYDAPEPSLEPEVSYSQPAPEAASYPQASSVKPLPRYQGGTPPITGELAGSGQVIRHQGRTGPASASAAPPETAGPINSLFYQDSSRDLVERLMEQALTRYRAGDRQGAMRHLEEALQLNPRQPKVLAAKGEILIEQNRFDEAEAAYEQAAALAPEASLLRYAEVLILNRKSADARALLERFLQGAAPSRKIADKARAHYMLGTLYQQAGEFPFAISQLKTAAELSPRAADIQYNLGLAYELQGKLSLAQTHYQQALTLNPEAEDARAGLRRTGL